MEMEELLAGLPQPLYPFLEASKQGRGGQTSRISGCLAGDQAFSAALGKIEILPTYKAIECI